jgi:superoxide dismutase
MVVDVLGLGESVKEYKPSKNLTIGVNDISKYHNTDIVVCLDRIHKFNRQRALNIVNNTGVLYTHLFEWKNLKKNIKIIELAKGRGTLDALNEIDVYPYSNNSTYLAVVLAYKKGAKIINLYGADFNTHKNFKGNLLKQALKDWKNLSEILKLNGCTLKVTKQSKLSEFLETI